MASPASELHRAIYTALTADGALMALISNVYDRVEVTSTGSTPASVWGSENAYIRIGSRFTVYEEFECVEVHEVNIQLDVFSRQVGSDPCQVIVDEARRVALTITELTENALILAEAPLARIIDDPDGLTTHGIINLRYEVEAR